MPKKLIVELEEFIERNSLAVVALRVSDKGEIHQCCGDCLKAHAIKKAREFGLDEEKIELLKDVFEDNSHGHGGHYMDSGELIEI
ncbi:MAG: hypothetical protein ABIH92_05945 [Nanoarchaeota archaeon]